MSQSAISKLIAGAFAVFVSREFSGERTAKVTNREPQEAENGDVIKVNRGAYDTTMEFTSAMAPTSSTTPVHRRDRPGGL